MRKLAGIAGFALIASSALADTAQPATSNVNVYQYALEHPANDTSVPFLPVLGESVPAKVKIEEPQKGGRYGYFYYAGQPIIVDLATRSVVRIGQ
ncbi:hypothetical protein [Consotaella salsifontis]|uniref:Nickel/cobalt transporter regulator n=1 Tax=Consotaella salsifontis TaxID=1365950 RepID=A0A1T4QG65_9HYPH|nr:hypothetical protein [Consotaella salsifontis]SKA02719.1 hypothetical protein SAMN05428963_10533 [Consotaella salsifontis]